MFATRADAQSSRAIRGAVFCVAVAGWGFAVAASGAETPTGALAPGSASLVAEALAYEHGEGVAKDQLKAAALY